MFSHKVYLEGCTLELKKICDDFTENAMQDDFRLVREAKEHEKEASKRYDEYLKSKDKND